MKRSAEIREASGQITINALKAMAEAMSLKLVYGIIPRDQSLETLIENRATENCFANCVKDICIHAA